MSEVSGTVDKACAVLDLLLAGPPRATVTDIARRIGASRTATLRLVNTLVAHGLLEVEDRRYDLGPKVTQLAHARARHNPLGAQLRPVVRRLVERTGCHGYFGYLRGSEAVLLGMEAGTDALAVVAGPGEVYAAQEVAFGLALLIGDPPPGWTGHLTPGVPFVGRDGRTVVPQEKVEDAWRRGVAVCHDLTYPGMYAYGIALQCAERMGGISLSFTVLGKTPEQIAAVEAQVIEALLELKRSWSKGAGNLVGDEHGGAVAAST
jgi:DNA-binding IclR family transcriptional regulator